MDNANITMCKWGNWHSFMGKKNKTTKTNKNKTDILGLNAIKKLKLFFEFSNVLLYCPFKSGKRGMGFFGLDAQIAN